LQTQGELLLRPTLGAKVEHLACRFGAGDQIWRVEATGARPLQIGKQRAARIGRNRRYRIADRTETESVQAEGGRIFS
jgi:hypothetical protein